MVTQGRYDAKQWVTSFIISYSQDKYRWIRYKKYGRVKVRNRYDTAIYIIANIFFEIRLTLTRFSHVSPFFLLLRVFAQSSFIIGCVKFK